jgi:hypothetical protein
VVVQRGAPWRLAWLRNLAQLSYHPACTSTRAAAPTSRRRGCLSLRPSPPGSWCCTQCASLQGIKQ